MQEALFISATLQWIQGKDLGCDFRTHGVEDDLEITTVSMCIGDMRQNWYQTHKNKRGTAK